jgi:hypothetical protein
MGERFLRADPSLNGVVPFQGKYFFDMGFPGRLPWAKERLRRWRVVRNGALSNMASSFLSGSVWSFIDKRFHWFLIATNSARNNRWFRNSRVVGDESACHCQLAS